MLEGYRTRALERQTHSFRSMGGVGRSRPLVTFDMDGVLSRNPWGINPGGVSSDATSPARLPRPTWPLERWLYLRRKPMPGAVEGFHAIAERFECAIVSARGEGSRPLTEDWLPRPLRVPSPTSRTIPTPPSFSPAASPTCSSSTGPATAASSATTSTASSASATPSPSWRGSPANLGWTSPGPSPPPSASGTSPGRSSRART